MLAALVTVLALSTLAAPLVSCGADDRLAPYSAPPPDCAEADDYLAPLYALEAQGRIANLAFVIRERVPDAARRDLVDALLRVAGSFEDGDFSALAALPLDDPEAPGLQRTLGALVRWLAQTGPSAPNLPLTGLLRRTLATCEGGPVFTLLAEAVRDPELLPALLDTLSSEGLVEGLRGLDFEGQNGREAVAYLVRNLLVAASSPSFDVASILDLLDLVVDLDAEPYRALADGLLRLLDADGLAGLQSLLVCLGRVDPDLVLGGFAYDFLTSGLLGTLLPSKATTFPEPLREIAAKALATLGRDAEARRGLVPALLVFLADDVAPVVLVDVATLLEERALGGLLDLVIDLASGTCRAEAPQ